jgi:hypothetical protein
MGRWAGVWLGGNLRPVLAVVAVAVAVPAAAAAATVWAGGAESLAWAWAGLAATLACAGGGLAACAALPRLSCRPGELVVRLSPWRAHRVPLGIVECVFHGSQPMTGPALRHVHGDDPGDGAAADRRIGTLVIRLAERATDWAERPTFGPWGAWEDGHIIIDGRWCEPLTSDLARRISELLVEAKRAAGSA